MGIQIINGGFLTTVQDMGRYGYQETGMSVSGVMDTRAASLANILVGNDTNEAVIEITMMGPTMKFTEDEIIAVFRLSAESSKFFPAMAAQKPATPPKAAHTRIEIANRA